MKNAQLNGTQSTKKSRKLVGLPALDSGHSRSASDFERHLAVDLIEATLQDEDLIVDFPISILTDEACGLLAYLFKVGKLPVLAGTRTYSGHSLHILHLVPPWPLRPANNPILKLK